MNPQQPYEAWKQQRRRVEVPAGFADRVMARIRHARRQSRLLCFLTGRYAAAAAIVLGVLWTAARLGWPAIAVMASAQEGF